VQSGGFFFGGYFAFRTPRGKTDAEIEEK